MSEKSVKCDGKKVKNTDFYKNKKLLALMLTR